MALSRLKDVSAAYDAGRFTYTSWRKVPAISGLSGSWTDLSMSPGFPRPNYYTGDPLTSKTLNGNYGLWHAGAVSPYTKYLHKIQISQNNTNVIQTTFLLCDYLLYYPLIDMDSPDEQTLTTTVTLPRYTDGAGVYPMLVATNPYIGAQKFVINYTNHLGESGRVSQPIISNQSTFISSVVHSGGAVGRNALDRGPFMPLAPGDIGVRSVESITFNAPNGGLACLVLIKPLATFFTGELNATVEIDYMKERGAKLPEIEDGAYLNFLILCYGNPSTRVLYGDMQTIWG